MPVAFRRPFGQGGFAPIARPRFLLGSDLDCDLVDPTDGVAEHHATVRVQRGEYVLVAKEGCALWIEGKRVPLISLRDGDAVALTPHAMPWQFRSRVEGTFWPPEVTIGEAWLKHPEYARAAHGPLRFGEGRAVHGRDGVRTRLVNGPHGPLVVKHLGPITEPKDATHHLRFLGAVGGAVHPALAPVCDGGVAPYGGEDDRWIATRYVEGVSAAALAHTGPVSPGRVVRALRSLAEGLEHLHHRGVVHANVSLDNVVVPRTNLAVLIDYGAAHALENPVRPPVAGSSPPVILPPEAADGTAPLPATPWDVYGLAAVGRALLAGSSGPPEDASLPTFGQLLRDGPAELDAVAEALEASLVAHPAGRPSAAALADVLAAAEDRLAVAGRS